MSNYNHSSPHYRSSRPQSFMDKMTKNERIWAIIGLFFLVTGGGFFLALIIALVIVNSVQTRDRTKIRISNVLENRPNTNVSELAQTLDKSEDHITTVLKIMILEEGAQIRFDLVNKTVMKVGDLDYGFGGSRRYNAPAPTRAAQQSDVAHPVEVSFNVAGPSAVSEPIVPRVAPVAHPVPESINQSSAQPVAPVTPMDLPQYEVASPKPALSCAQCGEKLPVSAKYCNSCGVRQL